MAKTTCYLVLEPEWSHWQTDANGEPVVSGMRVSKTLKKRPLRAHGPIIKLTLSLPDQVFKPVAPEVVIDVPPEALDYEPVVQVDIPDGDGDG